MGEKGIYYCEICELEFHDLDEFDNHCQQVHETISIQVVRENIKELLSNKYNEGCV